MKAQALLDSLEASKNSFEVENREFFNKWESYKSYIREAELALVKFIRETNPKPVYVSNGDHSHDAEDFEVSDWRYLKHSRPCSDTIRLHLREEWSCGQAFYADYDLSNLPIPAEYATKTSY